MKLPRGRMSPPRRSALKIIGGASLAWMTGAPPARGQASCAGPKPCEPPQVRSVVARGSANYDLWRQSMVWQRRKSSRYPEQIIQVNSEAEVVAAVRYARANGLRIATRCGGHSVSACFLRDQGILLDVSRLRHMRIDAASRSIDVGPGVTGQELNAALLETGLAFPTAHCGMVPLGGFLLGGGLGLNGNGWGGFSTFNIRAARVVTADGEIRHASESENPELLWAVRGGGPGLFGVVTGFTLDAYPAPRAILSNQWTFRFSDIETVVGAFAAVAPRIDRNVELLAYVGPAETPPAGGDPVDQRLAVYLNANVYAVGDTTPARIQPLAEHAIVRRAYRRHLNQAKTIAQLYQEEERGFSQRRWGADNVFTRRPVEFARVLRNRMPASPARDAQAVLLFKGRPQLPAAACSVVDDFYAAFYAIWDDQSDDAVMMDYVHSLYADVVPLGSGSNINEMNQEGRRNDIPTCYSPESWATLARLRAKWDPQQVFHDFFGRS